MSLENMPVDQLAQLSETKLIEQGLLLITTTNNQGLLTLDDGTSVYMDQCIREFATNSKSRDGNKVRKQLKEHKKALHDIQLVSKY